MRRRLGIALAAALALPACGSPSADLFAVDRDGPAPGAKLRLVVSDGGDVSCNGREHELPNDLLLDARPLARDLDRQAELGLRLPPGPDAVMRYEVHVEAGTVAFADTSRQLPDDFRDVAAFTRRVAREVCDLPR